jgi:NAD(P)-dependent dehydrogenase (short-subunit alcohol dehydrogenase family)
MTGPFAMFSLEGRRALVTGAGRGIGRAIAKTFSAAGARVALNDVPKSPDLAAAVAACGAGALAAPADLARRADRARLVEHVMAAFGGLDILVLNAAIQERTPWDRIDEDAIDRQVELNLKAGHALIRAFLPGMVERGWGRLLAIGSIQEAKENPAMLIYAATKAAQTSMVRNLARQLATTGVTCNTLAPGVVATERNTEALADPAYRERSLSQIPMGRFGKPEDCVGAALLLASDAGRYITGERLFVDGGKHL